MVETIVAAGVAVIAVALLVGAAFLIPAVRQVRRTAARVETLIVRYEEELEPLVTQARRTLAELQRGAGTVEAITGRIDQVIHVLDQVSGLLAGVRVTVGRTVTPSVATVAGAVEGIRQALHFLFKERAPDGKKTSGSSTP